MAYIGNKPANKAVVASDLDPAVITGQTALAVAPADTDEFLISDAGTLKRIDASLIGGGGITVADTWRITANHSGTGFITANWERDDTYGNSLIGSGMSQSSGEFTFPSTGFYMIHFASRFSRGTNAPYVYGDIQVTTDNSSYNTAASGAGSISGADYYDSVFVKYIFDVTSTSTHKVKFKTETNNTAVGFNGDTNANQTYAIFMRIGDT